MPTIPTLTQTTCYSSAALVTASDTVDLPLEAVSLFVTVAGNVSFLTTEGVIISITAAPVGVIPIRCKRVRSTGTTATVAALY